MVSLFVFIRISTGILESMQKKEHLAQGKPALVGAWKGGNIKQIQASTPQAKGRVERELDIARPFAERIASEKYQQPCGCQRSFA